MTPKQRVLKTLHHEKPDRVPVFTTVTPQIGDALNEYFSFQKFVSVNSFFSNRISYTEVLNKLGNDCVGVSSCTPKGFTPKVMEDGTKIDEWGIGWKSTGVYDEMSIHPLSEIEEISDLDRFVFPDPYAEGKYDLAEKMIKQYGKEYAIVGEQECVMFELSWYLVGLEKFITDMALGKKYVYELMDRVMDINIKIGCKLIELGSDIIWTGDDVGDQNGMMISPELWRREFKPRLSKVLSTFKKVNSEVKIAYHSCGSILPIIPDLIEIGLDILNPLQPAAAGMNPKYLKDAYGNDLVFFGAIDVQHLLPRGTPEEVKKSVKEIISILGEDGGYILAPAHNIQPDTPIENILAMYEAVQE